MSKLHKHRLIKLKVEIEKKIVEIATKNPRKDYKLPFSIWSVRVRAGYASQELNHLDSISHTEIRDILLKHGIKYRQPKITLDISTGTDSEYHLKKKELRN